MDRIILVLHTDNQASRKGNEEKPQDKYYIPVTSVIDEIIYEGQRQT